MPELKDFLQDVANGGMKVPISSLGHDHCGVLLDIWHINHDQANDVHRETKIADGFTGERNHRIDDPCVQELFDWGYLKLMNGGETYVFNPELEGHLGQITERYQETLQ